MLHRTAQEQLHVAAEVPVAVRTVALFQRSVGEHAMVAESQVPFRRAVVEAAAELQPGVGA
jgi:hypothetical protein